MRSPLRARSGRRQPDVERSRHGAPSANTTPARPTRPIHPHGHVPRPSSCAIAIPTKPTVDTPTPARSTTQRANVDAPDRDGKIIGNMFAGDRPPGGRWPWVRSPWFGSAIVVVLALTARAPGYFRQLFDPDEGAIATMGMVVARGGELYRDVIDRKPPISAFVYAGSFLLTGNRDLRPLHLVAALTLGASAVVLAYGARRVAGPTAGWWAAGLLIAGAIAMRPVDAQAANFGHLALLPACGAIVAARSGSRRSALLAGVLLGVATLTRQTWVIGVVPAAYAAWWWGGRRLGRALLVIAGTVTTVAAIAIVVPFGPFWHWTFGANGSVLSLTESETVLARGSIAIDLFLVAHIAMCWLCVRRGWRRDDLDLWLWLGTGLVAFIAGFRFFGHYWLQVLPPLCFLAGLGIAACRPSVRRMLVVAVAVPALAAWVLAFSPGRIDPRIRALATYVRTHTRPTDRVTVWGSAAELYWLSGRDPGGALITTDFVVGKTAGRADGPQRLRDATPGARATFLRSLRAHPPKLFLDTSTAKLRTYDHYPLDRIPSVAAFVRKHYRRVATVRGVTVYELRSGS